MPAGPLTFHDGEQSVLYELDFSARHEIATGGETITGVTIGVLLNGVTSTRLTIASIAVVGSGTKVQFRVSDSGAQVGDKFELKCTAVLSGGATLVECGLLNVKEC